MTATGWRLAIVGIAAFAVFLVVRAPASVVARAVAAADPAVTITGTSGTAWRGRAQHVQHGGLALGVLEWRLHVLPLLIGRTSFDATLAGPNGRLAARVSRTLLTGSTRVSDATGAVPLAALARVTGEQGPVEALVEIHDVGFATRGADVVRAEGAVRLRSVFALAPQRYPLGSYTLGLSAEDGWLVARVTDATGPLTLGGDARVRGDGQWVIDARVRATQPESDVALVLQFLGEADAEGYRRMRLEGVF